jgi:hypothetical protein
MRPPSNEPLRINFHNHAIYIFVVLLGILCGKIAEGRVRLVICTTLVAFWYWQRLHRLSNQILRISKGDLGFPSLVNTFDSFALIDVLLLTWGFWLLCELLISHQRHYSLVDCFLLCFLFSQLVFLAMAVLDQILISFFFATCVRHGFFLFSILPRFVASVRTFLVSFMWFDLLQDVKVAPLVLKVLYVILKLVLFLIWVSDFVHILISKDFPPEFRTASPKSSFTCPVCFENVMLYITLPCSHNFCLPCFCKWGSIRPNCPMCRANFSSWIHQVELQHLLYISFMVL